MGVEERVKRICVVFCILLTKLKAIVQQHVWTRTAKLVVQRVHYPA